MGDMNYVRVLIIIWRNGLNDVNYWRPLWRMNIQFLKYSSYSLKVQSWPLPKPVKYILFTWIQPTLLEANFPILKSQTMSLYLHPYVKWLTSAKVKYAFSLSVYETWRLKASPRSPDFCTWILGLSMWV